MTAEPDIVDDLREHPVTIARDAADEIDRLRRRTERLTGAIKDALDDLYSGYESDAEGRLRRALTTEGDQP